MSSPKDPDEVSSVVKHRHVDCAKKNYFWPHMLCVCNYYWHEASVAANAKVLMTTSQHSGVLITSIISATLLCVQEIKLLR